MTDQINLCASKIDFTDLLSNSPILSDENEKESPKSKRAIRKRSVSQTNEDKEDELLKTKTRPHLIDKRDALRKRQEDMPGREGQLEDILSFVKTKLLYGISGFMYISGAPGTGKTTTVYAALHLLKEEIDLPDFQFVQVDGTKITKPREAYVEIYKRLTGKSVEWKKACSLLGKRFTTPGMERTPTVLFIDDVDALYTGSQDVLYSIMNWASNNTALLTVLAVANMINLPERTLGSCVVSRLSLTSLTFPPYTDTQLQKIILSNFDVAKDSPDGVKEIARKMASVSGDARRALALFTRALELTDSGIVDLEEVELALGQETPSVAVKTMRKCSPTEKLMIRAIAVEVNKTGLEGTTISSVLDTVGVLMALEELPYKAASSNRALTSCQAIAICSKLAASRLIMMGPMSSELKLFLNVSTDDVYNATKEINVMYVLY